ILRRHGVAPDRVILELTEREAVRQPERLREALREVQRAGVRVAADDVGAGNAGLRLLSQFQFDVVKIDLSLVQGGSRGDQNLSVLSSLAHMADRLGAMTIAEGVETPDQLRMIRELGIVAGQGYLLGRPGTDHSMSRVDLEALATKEDVPDPQSPVRTRSTSGPTDSRDLIAALGGRAATDPDVPSAAPVSGGPINVVRRNPMTFLAGRRPRE
ncbi:MAG TPA: EAL domain-containing protein, partial [Candidatus Acidoferrales bacterium]|nr:EAL domain-containing protein [Candidatus Acidoferrales bacterium]